MVRVKVFNECLVQIIALGWSVAARWSSVSGFAGQGASVWWAFWCSTRTHNSYDALGNNAEQRQYAYRELFRQKMDSALIHDVRESLNQELVLGSDKFKDKIKEMSKRQVRRGRDGRPSIRV